MYVKIKHKIMRIDSFDFFLTLKETAIIAAI